MSGFSTAALILAGAFLMGSAGGDYFLGNYPSAIAHGIIGFMVWVVGLSNV